MFAQWGARYFLYSLWLQRRIGVRTMPSALKISPNRLKATVFLKLSLREGRDSS